MDWYNDYTFVDFLLYYVGPFAIIPAAVVGAIVFKFIDGIGLDEEKKAYKEFKKILKSHPEIQEEIDNYYPMNIDRIYHEADVSRYYELYGDAPREIIEKYTKKKKEKNGDK